MFSPNLKRRKVPLSENAQGQHRWTPDTETIFCCCEKQRKEYLQAGLIPSQISAQRLCPKGVGLTEGQESFREEHTGKWGGGGRKREEN